MIEAPVKPGGKGIKIKKKAFFIFIFI
jgi:hypothetical protein